MKTFIKNLLCGALIGVAIIVPGLSGGSIAVITRIYTDIIDSISSIFKNFKKSFFTLLPILIGVVAGLVIVFIPIKLALEYAPLPTVMLFAGLIAGTLPALFKDGLESGFKPVYVISIIIPAAIIIAVAFIPNMGAVDLTSAMPVWGYFALLGMGILASAAFVVPGVSGSMILFVFGYYYPILETFSSLVTAPGHSLLVLIILLAGVLIGFFFVSKLIKFFLTRFACGTYWAITGFVLGSIPAIFIVFPSNFPDATYTALQISLGVVLAIVGIALGFLLTYFAGKKHNPLLPLRRKRREKALAKMAASQQDTQQAGTQVPVQDDSMQPSMQPCAQGDVSQPSMQYDATQPSIQYDATLPSMQEGFQTPVQDSMQTTLQDAQPAAPDTDTGSADL